MDGGPANLRAWTPIRVCGREVAIVPTNRAVQTIEVRLNIGMPALIARFMSGDLRVRDMNVVVDECLRGAGYVGKDGQGGMFDYDAIGEDIMANLTGYSNSVGQMLGQVFGPSLPKDEPPPRAAEPSP